ncbi:MAG: ATP-binding cassette domain-containing protein [Acidaminobacter sp.]|uniref:ABC transporter ATP-binding protein n=1 Tax=Acidaminobacter sp. TaxID=1872102 RepID=UPI001382D6B4|nr:ABC transporter ATP-binding protein [Acidaminobacter sp.]MZQ98052.1 ATP-binding cassette domain-containing protein [Acidaminobacter sp.]
MKPPKKTFIKLERLKKSFGREVIFEDFNLDVYDNEILVIMGPSGAGKSTLLNVIGQLEPCDSGEVHYHPELFEGTKVPLPFVFQEFDTLLPWKTVEGNIRLVAKDLSETELQGVLDTVALSEHRHKKPAALSGGMKQRVGIARALVCHSKILLMDEPFGSLDRDMRLKMQDFLLDLQHRTGLTIVLVTHDLEEAEKLGTRIVRL